MMALVRQIGVLRPSNCVVVIFLHVAGHAAPLHFWIDNLNSVLTLNNNQSI